MGREHVPQHVARRAVAAGFTVHFLPGWKTRERPYTFTPIVQYRHGTASPPTSHNLASLAVVRDGRAGIPGPLAQFYGSGCRRGATPELYVIGCSRANHAGRAVWKVIHDASRGIAPTRPSPNVADDVDANRYAWAVEWEHSNRPDEPVTDAMLTLMAVTEAAIAEAEGWTSGGTTFAANHGIDHREATRRKIDLPSAVFGDVRTRVANRLSGVQPQPPPQEDDDMICQKGDRGQWVERLQGRLNIVRRYDGLDPIAVDGVYGDSTEAALADALRRRGIASNGTFYSAKEAEVITAAIAHADAGRFVNDHRKEPHGGTADLSGYAKTAHTHETGQARQ